MSDNFNNESTNVLIIGKSGVGKSSLVNYLFGKELQPVGHKNGNQGVHLQI